MINKLAVAASVLPLTALLLAGCTAQREAQDPQARGRRGHKTAAAIPVGQTSGAG